MKENKLRARWSKEKDNILVTYPHGSKIKAQKLEILTFELLILFNNPELFTEFILNEKSA